MVPGLDGNVRGVPVEQSEAVTPAPADDFSSQLLWRRVQGVLFSAEGVKGCSSELLGDILVQAWMYGAGLRARGPGRGSRTCSPG